LNLLGFRSEFFIQTMLTSVFFIFRLISFYFRIIFIF
jgi:hypothetical protein